MPMTDPDAKTLVILLCMHRSGSSYTASALRAMGMSLGPYPLLGAHASNIHGHFESVPFYELNRRVQEIAFGFPDDLPTSEELMNRFVAGKGVWPADLEVPDELVREGRRLLGGLVESGPVSGFKDPRTVLTWPFWKRVLEEFRAVRVVMVPLLRSPHEIAVSLATRSQGAHGYWSSLDLVAIHYDRMKAVLATETDSSNVVRFGDQRFVEDLEAAALRCGLEWTQEQALGVFDRDSVHQEPAAVCHEAQTLFEELGGERPSVSQKIEMGWLQARDAQRCEAMARHRARGEIDALREEVVGRARQCAALEHQAAQQAARSQAILDQTRNELAHACDQLSMARADAARVRESERLTFEECQRLRAQLERMESHPVLGLLLKSRRRVKRLLASSAAHFGLR